MKHEASPIDDDLVNLTFHAVTRERLNDLVMLFESRGGPKNCWCMVWRAMPARSKTTDGPSRRAAFLRQIKQGVPVGILGYVADTPMAWCSIAPRPTYRELGGPAEDVNENVWSLVCFFVPRAYRRQGVTGRLLQAAIDHARQQGATIVEAYPVDPDSPSYRFMGFVGAFKKAGFVEVGRAGTRRHVMRLKLIPTA